MPILFNGIGYYTRLKYIVYFGGLILFMIVGDRF